MKKISDMLPGKADGTRWRSRIIGEGVEAPDQLLANPQNWRVHPKFQQDVLSSVLDEVGWIQEVIVNQQTGHLIDGHLRVTLAMRHEEKEIPVKYVDLTLDEEALILATLDPLAGLAVADDAKLRELHEQIESDDAAIMAMLDQIKEDAGILEVEIPPEDPGAQVDRAEELREKWGVESGQLWRLGKHRLVCGDCTDGDVVARVMDIPLDLMLLDPPYGIKRDKGFDGFDGFGGKGKPIGRRQYIDDWDSERPSKAAFEAVISSAPKAIIFGGNFFTDILPQGNHWIVWDKQNTMPTFGDCELAWTNIQRDSIKKYTVVYNGLIGKEKDRFHPTQKPVAIMDAIIDDYSETGDVVGDWYVGSGTTLIACQRLNRKCRAVEISPAYCAVTIERFYQMTGIDPVLMDNG